MEEFVKSGTDDTIATAFNPLYPDIDAVAHLNLQPVGGKPFRMTVFMNVAISSSHELGNDCIEHLKYLITKTNRPSGFFWISNEVFKANKDLLELIPQFSIHSNVTSKPKSKSEVTNLLFSQFNNEYAKKHNMTYQEAMKSEDRKTEYSEYKKKEKEKNRK